MNKYVTLENEYYELLIPNNLQEYGKEILKYSTLKIKEYLHFFKEETYGEKIKCSIFLNREDFIKRIKEKANYIVAPSWTKWSKGSYCGEEVQNLFMKETTGIELRGLMNRLRGTLMGQLKNVFKEINF